ncbi:MAG: thiamine-binding protein [Bacteroidota bacterium]
MSIQIVPKTEKADYYPIIDEAIEAIKASGLKHMVTPFSTVIEGSYDELMELARLAQQKCLEAGANELLVNIQLHLKQNADVTFEEKISKHT